MSEVLCDEPLLVRDVQVAGWHHYPESRWREAILAFLFGVWSGSDVLLRPKMIFGGLTLRLDLDEKRYFAYGKGIDDVVPDVSEDAILSVGDSQAGVETGLVRFVKNDRIKVLQICFCNGGSIAFWKRGKRGQYGCCSGKGIPISFGGLGSYGEPR